MKPLLLHRPGGDLVVVTRPFVTSSSPDDRRAKTRLWFAVDDCIDVAETVEQIASALGAVAVGGSA